MPRPTLRTFADIVNDYRLRHQDRAARELRFFAIQRTLDGAVRLAATATGPGGKRWSHQRRIPAASLADAERELIAVLPQIRRSRDFADLHQLIKEAIDPIPKIGELTIYDTALRIGAKLGVLPARVYLHAGTRAGARSLGLSGIEGSVRVSDVPAALRRFEPHEIEDCLCIYKRAIAAIVRRGSTRESASNIAASAAGCSR